MKSLLYAVLGIASVTSLTSIANAGGQWSDQYCNAKSVTVEVKDKVTGEVIESKESTTIVCEDGRKDFLAYGGIAKSCTPFEYKVLIRGELLTRRGFSCEKLGGGYEIVTRDSHPK